MLLKRLTSTAESGQLFAVSDGLINLFSLTYMFLFLPGTLMAAWMLESAGLRASLIVGAAGNLACGVIRLGALFMISTTSDDSTRLLAWGVSLAGQIGGAISQPFFLNVPAKVAGDWFPKSERDIATVLAAMSNPLGNAIGMVLPILFVDSDKADVEQFQLLFGVQAAIAAAGLVLVLIVVRDRPPTPPSSSAGSRDVIRIASLQRVSTGKGSVWSDEDDLDGASDDAGLQGALSRDTSGDSHGGAGVAGLGGAGAEEGGLPTLTKLRIEWCALLGDGPFRLLLLAFGLGLGIFNSFVTLVAQFVGPCGYDSTEAGIFGGALIGAGLLGAGVAGAVLEATRAYTTALRAGFLLCGAAVIGLMALLQPHQGTALTAMFAVAGFLMLPLLPVTLEAGAEHTFPIPEESSTALLLLGGQLFGIIFVLLLPVLIPDTCDTIVTPSAGLVVGVMVVACGSVLFFAVSHRRGKAETAAKRPLLAAE